MNCSGLLLVLKFIGGAGAWSVSDFCYKKNPAHKKTSDNMRQIKIQPAGGASWKYCLSNHRSPLVCELNT
jgi:hypothetical protein